MTKFTVFAALLMTTSYAYAGNNSIAFEINGHKVRIESPKNCDQLSCLKISGVDFASFNSRSSNDDVAVQPDAPAQTPSPAPAVQAATPEAPVANPAPTAIAPAPVKDVAAPVAPPAVSAVAPAPVTAAPVPAATTPIGVWNTEKNKGQVRIEACGENLCGYTVKTGEKILINMKPSETKWIGTIHDPDSGSNYDSTIAMKGMNSLQVRGCAFGGLFCGGQVWNRAS